MIKWQMSIIEEPCSDFSHGFNQRSAPNFGCCSMWECGTQLGFKWLESELQKCSNADVADQAQFLVINHLSLGIAPLLVSHITDVCGNKMADGRDTQLPFMFCTGIIVKASSQMVHDPSGLAIHYLSLGWSGWDFMLHTCSLPPGSSTTVADHWY